MGEDFFSSDIHVQTVLWRCLLEDIPSHLRLQPMRSYKVDLYGTLRQRVAAEEGPIQKDLYSNLVQLRQLIGAGEWMAILSNRS